MAAMLAGLGTLVQVGFALALGVLLDTMLIRPLLVPALMLMVWRYEERAAEPALLRASHAPSPILRRRAPVAEAHAADPASAVRRPQPGGTANAARVAKLRLHQWSIRFAS